MPYRQEHVSYVNKLVEHVACFNVQIVLNYHFNLRRWWSALARRWSCSSHQICLLESYCVWLYSGLRSGGGVLPRLTGLMNVSNH